MLKEHKYSDYSISPTDRIFVRYVTKSSRGRPARVVRFYILYQSEVDGEARDIVEFDNCHGTAHMHYFDRNGKKGRGRRIGMGLTDAASIQEILVLLKSGMYKHHKQWYLHR